MNPLYETWVGLHESLTYQRTLRWDPDPFLPGEAEKPRIAQGAPRSVWRRQLDEEQVIRHVRMELCTRFAWAVPSPCAIRFLVGLGPIVEVGAGLGYWARCVEDAGGDIIATDAKGESRGRFFPTDSGEWFDVVECSAEFAASAWPERTLLLVWPPPNDPMADRALAAYLRAGGRQVVFVGERYGVTGDERFERRLELVFGDADERVEIPRWESMHDAMFLFRRQP